ncbi:MAG: flagellar assembly protein FliW [Desulfovibrio sp.]|nr:flagellar assembly protein FliW [Desulfovibrio sp.]
MASEKTIEIDTRLGRRVIDPATVINFPRGLAGFEDEHEFTLLPIRPDAPLLILQSMRRPEVGLLVADPYSFLESYPVMLGDAEQQLLKVDKSEDTAILVTVTIPEGKPEDAMLNLTGPIIINHHTRIGIQIPQGFEGPTQVSLHAPSEASAN